MIWDSFGLRILNQSFSSETSANILFSLMQDVWSGKRYQLMNNYGLCHKLDFMIDEKIFLTMTKKELLFNEEDFVICPDYYTERVINLCKKIWLETSSS